LTGLTIALTRATGKQAGRQQKQGQIFPVLLHFLHSFFVNNYSCFPPLIIDLAGSFIKKVPFLLVKNRLIYLLCLKKLAKQSFLE
jgi:hypothetical protein